MVERLQQKVQESLEASRIAETNAYNNGLAGSAQPRQRRVTLQQSREDNGVNWLENQQIA